MLIKAGRRQGLRMQPRIELFVIALMAYVIVLSLSWADRAGAQGKRIFPRWWLNAALCVHSHEGGWHANTGNGFYGGMQFDRGTWLRNGGARYAPLAHLASPTNQLRVAYTTWKRRGWYPWPNTARMCGLI